MSIRTWPNAERPREKLMSRGGAALSDAELLAVFLGSGRRGLNAVDLGRSLLARSGSLKALLDKPDARGVGAVAWCRLVAALELGRRYLDAEMKSVTMLGDPSLSARYLKSRLCAYPYEVFACLFLDNRHRVIAFEELFRGSIGGASVHPREVVRRCLVHNAASQDDRTITLRLRDALALIDVRVLDHIIVGDGEPISLAERGWL